MTLEALALVSFSGTASLVADLQLLQYTGAETKRPLNSATIRRIRKVPPSKGTNFSTGITRNETKG